MTDIINSNLNALLDKAEDPEKMVRLIIQEMEETLVEVRTVSARTIADKKELGRRRDWLKEESAEWERKAEVAIRKGRDDLARAAIAERNKARENADSAASELVLLESTLAKLSDDTAQLQTKIKDAKVRQNAIIMRGKAAKTRLGVKRQLNDANLDDAIQRFEQYERKMDDLEGQIEAFDLGQRTLADEIKDLEGGEKIDEDLKALKARVGGTHSGGAQACFLETLVNLISDRLDLSLVRAAR
jgi:phage shock protein A